VGCKVPGVCSRSYTRASGWKYGNVTVMAMGVRPRCLAYAGALVCRASRRGKTRPSARRRRRWSSGYLIVASGYLQAHLNLIP
jgi:hypothetical protein